MVRLGTGASALDKLDEMLTQIEIPEDGEEPTVWKKADRISPRNLANNAPLDIDILETIVEEIETRTWRDYMKAARKARDMRLIDEKFAKYGPLKDFVKGNPHGEAFVFKLEKAWNTEVEWSNPIMPWGQAVVILFMAMQAGISDWKLLILSIIVLGIHPHLIVVGFVLYTVLKNRKTNYPKRTTHIPSWSILESHKEGKAEEEEEEENGLLPIFNKSRKEVTVDFDFIVLGTDLGSMYTAALLSRCGRRVLVLENVGQLSSANNNNNSNGTSRTDDAPVLEYGCLVKFDGLDFVVGDQTLPGGIQGQLYVNQLATALPPVSTKLSLPGEVKGRSHHDWYRIGESKGLHSIISVNKRSPILSGAGIDAKFEEWSKNGVDVKHAVPIITKLQEASQILSYGQKLPKKSMSEVTLMDRMVIALKKKLVENQVVASHNLSSVSAEEVLNNKALMGDNLVELRSRDPALYQLLLTHCVAQENLSPNDVSFMTLVTSFCDWLHGRIFPKHGFRSIFQGLGRTIRNSGGCVMRASIQEITVMKGATVGVGVDGKTAQSKVEMKIQGVRMKDGSLVVPKEGIIGGLGVHETVKLLPPAVLEGSALLKRLSKLRRARPVVHTLISLDPTASKKEKSCQSEDTGDDDTKDSEEEEDECLRVFSGQYTEIPSLIDPESGEICAASQGGAGCDPYCRNWMQINFPSAREEEKRSKISCVITTEAEDGWENEEQFNKFKPLHEKSVKKRLMELFPSIKAHHISKVKVLNPMYRGISSGVASSPESYENAQGLATLFMTPITEIAGLYFTSNDVIGGTGVKAQMIGASLCVHTVLGYDSTDVLMRQRSAIREIQSHS